MSTKVNMRYYINCFIGIAIMFGFRFLPAIEPLTHMGMQIIGIFIGTIWLWSTTENIWPSVLGLIALGTTEYCTIAEAIATGMSSPILWQLLLIMIVAGGVNETPFVTVVINWFMSRKHIQGKPWIISLIFLLITFGLVVFVNIPALILMWAMLYKMGEMVGYKKGDKYLSTMVVGMFVAFIFGNTFYPFTGIRAALIGAFTNMVGETIPYGTFMLVSLLVPICTLVVYIFAMKYLFKVDVSKLKSFSTEDLLDEKIILTKADKINIYVFLGGMFVLVLSAIVPASTALGGVLAKLTFSGIIALLLVVMSVIRIDGKALLNVPKMASKYVQWGVIFIVAAILPIANAVADEKTGINALFAQVFTPIFEGKSALVFMILITALALFLTNIGSNIGMGMLLLPIVVQVSPLVGANSVIIGLLMIYLVNIAYVLPGASPLASLLYGNEWITPKDIYKYGISAVVIVELVVCILIYPLLNIVL